jgi:hypothetical protein
VKDILLGMGSQEKNNQGRPSGHALSINKIGTGPSKVTSTTTGSDFETGRPVILGASPIASSDLFGWSAQCSGTSPPWAVTLTSCTLANAIFNSTSPIQNAGEAFLFINDFQGG